MGKTRAVARFTAMRQALIPWKNSSKRVWSVYLVETSEPGQEEVDLRVVVGIILDEEEGNTPAGEGDT